MGIANAETLRERKIDKPSWWGEARFGFISQEARGEEEQAIASVEGSPQTVLDSATSESDAERKVENLLLAKISAMLMIDPQDADLHKPLHTSGIDSLVAAELRNWIVKELKAEISIFDLLGTESISTLSLKVSKTTKLIKRPLPTL